MPYNPGIQSNVGDNLASGIGALGGNVSDFMANRQDPLQAMIRTAMQKQKAGLPLNDMESAVLGSMRQQGSLERAAAMGLGGAGFQRGMALYGAVKDGMAASKAAGGSGSVWQGLKSL